MVFFRENLFGGKAIISSEEMTLLWAEFDVPSSATTSHYIKNEPPLSRKFCEQIEIFSHIIYPAIHTIPLNLKKI